MTLARALLPLVTAAVWLCGACSADRSGTTPRSDPTDLMDVSVEDVLPDDGPGEDAANDPNADSSGEEDSTALQDVATGEDTASDLRDDPRDLTEDGDETPTCVPAEGAGFLTLMTRAGAVEGSEAEGVRRWLGVPYAAPPVGSLRWRPPQPPPCRATLLRAERVPPSCPQRDPARGSFEGNEDCLFLNLWAPATPPPVGGWPVLVFIHGGGNVFGGSGQAIGQTQNLVYDGARLASRGLIVVTLNYRLGALGWLSLPALDEEAGGPSTNFALLDQQAALRWLHEHLPALGGDPSRLHLFGESAGAVNTIMHLVSPQSEGLFGSVGIMSGGTSTRSLSAAQAEATRAIASSPCADLAGRPLLTCLRALSPEAVDAVLPGEVYIGSPQVRGASSSFGPVVDGVVLPEAPLERIRGGRHHRVPVLLGTTAEEMAELLDTTSIRSQADLERAIRLAFRPVVGNTGVDRIVETYPASSYDSAADAYIALYSDFRFVCPATLLIEALAAAQEEPLYRYWFARRGAVGQRRIPASHGRELGYLFGGIHRIPFFTPQQEDREVGEQMERAWAAMAERGSPRTEGTPTWDAWEAGRDNAYVFDAPAAIMDGVRSSECTMWRSLLGL